MLKHPVTVDLIKQISGTAHSKVQVRPVRGVECDVGTAVRDKQERDLGAEERTLGRLFAGYLNNKMTLLLFLIQAKGVKPNAVLVATVHSFLDDLYRHMLEGPLQRRYRRVFQWLKIFFSRLPVVSVYQRDRARDFICAIYDAFGLHLKEDV